MDATCCIIFTALHGMQTRSSDENSFCLSVCQAVRLFVRRVHCDKMEERSVQIFIPYERERKSTRRTRNSSEDEIANVNFLYDNILHALQNTIDSCINSARDRRGYVLERRFTKVSKITQCKTITPIRSFKVTDFGTNRKLIYDLLFVIPCQYRHK